MHIRRLFVYQVFPAVTKLSVPVLIGLFVRNAEHIFKNPPKLFPHSHAPQIHGICLLAKRSPVHITAEIPRDPRIRASASGVIDTAHHTSSFVQQLSADHAHILALGKNMVLIFDSVKSQMAGMEYVSFPSPLPHKIFQSPFSGLISIFLASRIFRRGIPVTAPMIQHLRHMDNRFPSPSFLIDQFAHGAQYQIIILGAVIPLPQFQPLHQFPFHYKKMADIIIGKKQVPVQPRFPMGFIKFRHIPVPLIFIRIKQPGSPSLFTSLADRLRHLKQGVLRQYIIVIQQADIIPMRQGKRRIRIFRDPLIFCQRNISYPFIRIFLRHLPYCARLARICQNQFKSRVALVQHRLDHLP